MKSASDAVADDSGPGVASEGEKRIEASFVGLGVEGSSTGEIGLSERDPVLSETLPAAAPLIDVAGVASSELRHGVLPVV